MTLFDFSLPKGGAFFKLFHDFSQNICHAIREKSYGCFSFCKSVAVCAYLKEQVTKINETLPPFERIQKIVIRDTDFPRTPAMKIDRKKASEPQ